MDCGDVLVSVVVFVCLSVCLFGFFKYCILSVFVTNKRIYNTRLTKDYNRNGNGLLHIAVIFDEVYIYTYFLRRPSNHLAFSALVAFSSN